MQGVNFLCLLFGNSGITLRNYVNDTIATYAADILIEGCVGSTAVLPFGPMRLLLSDISVCLEIGDVVDLGITHNMFLCTGVAITVDVRLYCNNGGIWNGSQGIRLETSGNSNQPPRSPRTRPSPTEQRPRLHRRLVHF